MVVAGIDVGARSTKAVLLRDGTILAFSEVISGEEATLAAHHALDAALAKVGLGDKDVAYSVATGVGGKSVPFAQRHSAEVVCQGRGAIFLHPKTRTVVNLGAESSRVLRLNDEGKVERFSTHDKCAAGSGLFLETVARILEVPLEDMGDLSLAAEEAEEVASMCAVFAESEVISHIHRGVPRGRILAGVHRAVVDRIIEVVHQVRPAEDIMVTGGVARNRAVVREMEERLKTKVIVPHQPELVGALGAALLAQDQAKKT